MALQKAPFNGIRGKKTASEKMRDIQAGEDKFTVRLNAEERDMLDQAKKILMVDRDSTALKELAVQGWIVIHDHKLGHLLQKIVKRIKKGYAEII
jgi:hypothetical protein